jgi:hypothetical protein
LKRGLFLVLLSGISLPAIRTSALLGVAPRTQYLPYVDAPITVDCASQNMPSDKIVSRMV